MKKKLLVFTASAITLFLVFMVFNVYAHGDDSESENDGVMMNPQQLNQNQNPNQGSIANMFKSGDSESDRPERPERPEKVETPERGDNGQSDQKEMERERGNNSQSDQKEVDQEKSDINNSADNNENEDNGIEENSQKMLMEKSNTIAKAVRQMLTVVAKNKGIGEQVKVIAKKQILNQEAIRESLGQAESRNKIVVFFIGPKYNEINKAKILLKQNNEQINQLSQIGKEISNKDDAKKLDEQVAVLQTTNNQVQKIIDSSENTFSLFGWLSKIFSR